MNTRRLLAAAALAAAGLTAGTVATAHENTPEPAHGDSGLCVNAAGGTYSHGTCTLPDGTTLDAYGYPTATAATTVALPACSEDADSTIGADGQPCRPFDCRYDGNKVCGPAPECQTLGCPEAVTP